MDDDDDDDDDNDDTDFRRQKYDKERSREIYVI
jgi:hypothetical protein